MQIKVELEGNFAEWAQGETLKAARAVTRGVHGATASLKAAWRADVSSTLGARMGNAVRSQVYPEDQPSLNAAGLVYLRRAVPGSPNIGAAGIVAAHSAGVVIRGSRGFWLAIPLPAAGRGKGGSRITPAEWQARTGRELRFVATGRGRAVLVADNSRVNTKGRAVLDRRRGKLQARRATTAVPIFALVPQVKLPKRLSLMQLAQQVGNTLPARIAGTWGG